MSNHAIQTGANGRKFIEIERDISAHPQSLFQAFASAEEIKKWFCPADFTVPAAEIDFRLGGVFAVCMRSPDGHDLWSRGKFDDIIPNECVAFHSFIEGQFTAHTRVTMTPLPPNPKQPPMTRLHVRQEYDIHDPAILPAMEGAPEGWRSTLDKLAHLMSRQVAAKGGVRQAGFCLERVLNAPIEAVYHAFTDPVAKSRWFGGGPGYKNLTRELDVRPGGRETVRGQWDTGMINEYQAVYFDVEANSRLVYGYDLWLNGKKLSVSLVTVQFLPEAGKCRLVLTEHGVYFGGAEDIATREMGTGFLLDMLEKSLA
ncbi:MAG: SRPBCC family protein [Alphaproteobacteria bacterium]|nr:SRPBCC family protein [Alphaproteobacteria bacterium]